MKTLFIEAKYTGSIDLEKINFNKLPKKIGLVSSVQFVDLLKDIKKRLGEKGIAATIGNGNQSYSGQVLGCDQSAAIQIQKKVDAFLYIGDGSFHPLGVAINTKKNVFTFNPISSKFEEVDNQKVQKILKKREGALTKFYMNKDIGVIISTKPGQCRIKDAEKLRAKFKDKEFYFVLFDTIDYSQLENFNFINCWVNTACPRIEQDLFVLNIDEIPSAVK